MLTDDNDGSVIHVSARFIGEFGQGHTIEKRYGLSNGSLRATQSANLPSRAGTAETSCIGSSATGWLALRVQTGAL